MSEIKIPEFLKPNPNRKKSRLSVLMEEYKDKIGDGWSTEEFNFNEKELERIFEQCLKENRTFYDVVGIDPMDYDEDDDL